VPIQGHTAGVTGDSGTPVPLRQGGPEDRIAVSMGESRTTGESNCLWPRIGPRAPSGGTGLGEKAEASYALESTGVRPSTFAFVENIHVSSNTCKDVQACANTGSVSDEKSKNVQIHASSSKDFAGSLLDGMAGDGEDDRFDRPLLSVRQVAKLLGVCAATVYRLCGQRKLPHFRVLNAIRIDPGDLKKFLAAARPRGPRAVAGPAPNASHRGEGGEPNRSA
jgi:excisionase family DNA binding protein